MEVHNKNLEGSSIFGGQTLSFFEPMDEEGGSGFPQGEEGILRPKKKTPVTGEQPRAAKKMDGGQKTGSYLNKNADSTEPTTPPN